MINITTRKVAKGVLATSLTLIACAVSAANNEPKEVRSTSSDTHNATKHELVQLFSSEATEQRYIVTFKQNQSTHAAGAEKQQSMDSASDSEERAVGFDAETAKSTLSRYGATVHKVLAPQGMVSASMGKKIYNQLLADPAIESVSTDSRRYLMAQNTPYGFNMVQANQFSQNDTQARKVCIIDTGYNLGHPDLPDQNDGVSGNANNSAVGNWYNDGNGHGTHVAGTIGALNNSSGIVGVYPGVDMHIVKIFDDNGEWTYASNIIDGVNQCQSAGANVVNMSLGGGSSSNAERNAMDQFNANGILLVAAAGNDGNSSLSYPASYDAVMSVAAVGSNESRASYSQYNSQVEIAGPGSAVYSTYPTNTYATLSGTSMATPHVAGAAALVWSFFPQCTNSQIRTALNVTAKDKGSAGRDNFYGHGIVKAADAYSYLNNNGCDGSGGGNGGGGAGVEPVSGQLNNLSGNRNSWKRYTWDVPAGVQTMRIEISGGTGDADLYVNLGSQPETNRYDCRPYREGNNEVCTFDAPSDGTWHIGIRAYSSYSGVTMTYSYE
ncbi:S8 family serine peptidase [Alteromonas oceanisediminis]|uniref:S8 family serine peptidase n=1 Tax=Alteromonas oceanisediminis TaxID=2836180 RepID=UPI001BDB5BA5|nr:S8 family serine peptidase [Alteromonas oceanisediminis]MBT0587757.1 S8 family peptidase [Alteromonas oceanisediminis]